MRKVIGFFLALAVAAFAAGWLNAHSGRLTLSFDQYEIQTSVAFALFGVAVLVAVLLAAASVVSALIRAPKRLKAHQQTQRHRKGLTALSNGMMAVASGDARAAERHAKDARNWLDEPPLTLLLSAQAAQISGNERDAEHHFAAMLAEPRTEFLGLRGLFLQAQRRGDQALALNHLRRAAGLKPGTPWVVTALFDTYAAEGRWAEAGETLSEIQRARLIDEQIARRRRAVLLAAEANAIAPKDPVRALSLAEDAVRQSPGLTSAAALAAQLLAKEGKVWRAQAVLENAWAQAPHPELAQIYAGLKPDDTPRARGSRLMALAERNKESAESRLLIAQQWAALKDFTQARAALGDLPERLSSARVAALMAEIAQAEGLPGESRYWLDRAMRAPRDPQWVCESCHGPAATWTPVCAFCNGFDTLSWRIRTETLFPLGPGEHPSSGPVLAPGTSLPQAIPSTALVLGSERADASATVLPPLAPPPQTPPPATEPKRPAPKRAADGEKEPVIFVSPRAPDDPGTDATGKSEPLPEHRW